MAGVSESQSVPKHIIECHSNLIICEARGYRQKSFSSLQAHTASHARTQRIYTRLTWMGLNVVLWSTGSQKPVNSSQIHYFSRNWEGLKTRMKNCCSKLPIFNTLLGSPLAKLGHAHELALYARQQPIEHAQKQVYLLWLELSVPDNNWKM